jgi:hypothetical protein
MSPSLSVVSNPPVNETIGERVRRLQEEAKALAKDHMQALTQSLGDVAILAGEIATGGDAYPPGVRDMARRLVEDCETRANTLTAIIDRQK